MGRGTFWSFSLEAGPQSSAFIGNLPDESGLLAMHREAGECGNGV